MSSPFPLEEASQQDSGEPGWDPWDKPAPPHWYSGFGFSEDTAYLGPLYRGLASVGSAAAKGELLLGGMYHGTSALYERGATAFGWEYGEKDAAKGIAEADAIQEDARQRIKALKPDPSTTGVAVQTLHGLGEGLTLALEGGALGKVGAFGALSTTQGYSSFKELEEQGVTPRTAAGLGAVRGLFAGAGAITPMTFGASLIPKLLTGMASNVGFGVANRSIDSAILRRAGYTEMADQEQAFDRTQMFVDLAMGAGFGAWAHISHAMAVKAALDADPANQDAALTANLALRDRQSGPGVPVDPEAAAAHSAALEKSVQDLQAGQHVNVAGTGVEESTVLSRGGEPNPEVRDLLVKSIQESGLLEEQSKLDELERILELKLSGEKVPRGEPDSQLTHEEGEVGDHTVKSAHGETIAQESGDHLIVKRDDTEPEFQGRGESTARMEALAKVAQEKGLTLASDVSVSPEKQRVFERLADSGYEVTRNPAEVNPDTGNLVSSDGRPVFEVRRGAEPLEQRLVSDEGLRAGLTAMKDETGWAETGGRLLMDADGKVLGRTKWIPREQWWADRPKGLNEEQVHAAVDKALAGQALGKRETAIIQFMAEVHDERVQRAATLAELRAAVPDVHEQPAPAVDLTVLASRAGEFDREAATAVLDGWEDDKPETIARVQAELERIIGRGRQTTEEGFRLESQTAGRGEPVQAERAARTIDLFGEDRSREQQLADEIRRRDLVRSPRGDVSLETGRSDDLFSQSVRQVDLTDERPFAQPFPDTATLAKAKAETTAEPAQAEGPEGRIAEQAVADKPALSIPEADGSTVPAGEAKMLADDELARTQNAAPTLFKALGDCFLRNGA